MVGSDKQSQLVEDIFAFCDNFIFVPEGGGAIKPLNLRPWQKDIIREIYGEPRLRRAIISFGRKNGKTALAAFLILCHLIGPCALGNTQIYSAAQSRDQAALVFSFAAKMIRLSPELNKLVTIRESRKELFCGKTGVTYRALSAEASTAYGLSPVFIVHDELGQVKGPRSELYEALETAVGAQRSPLSVIISTQAPTDDDLLSRLIDDARTGDESRTGVFLHTAPIESDPFDRGTIALANPALGDFLNETEVLAMAEDAKRMSSREPEYRNLILNQRVEASSPFVSRTLWNTCGAKPKPLTGVPVYAGLDLSSVADLTAYVMIGKVDGVWQVHPSFWLPGDVLGERARADRVPYDIWHKEGHLLAAPGKSVDYDYVAQVLYDDFRKLDIRKFAFDRAYFKFLRPSLLRAGFTELQIEEKFVEFGQGFFSFTPALRTLESEILNTRIAHGDHPVLKMCAANAVVQTDPAGNRKLTKQKSSGRIDGMVALTMAMGVVPEQEEPPRDFKMMIL
jgi:phage terminase large subunit-like protein